MRIPIPIAILITVLVLAGVWWLRTSDMDFMTPRGTPPPVPEFIVETIDDDDEPGPVVVDPGTEVVSPRPPAINPDQPPLEFGDLESAPGLAEYSEHAPKGAGYLIRLATELEVRGHFERALLAWERVIDSCNPSEAERTIAEDSIVRIRPTLPFWNIDPEGDIPVLLQIGTSRPVTGNLKEAAQEVAEFLRRDSDHTLLVTPRITPSDSPDAPGDAPIAIYFSATGDGNGDVDHLLSITPPGDDKELYYRQILAASYQLVRRLLRNAGGIVPPRSASHPDEPEANFQRQITRLHWKLFAQLLLHSPANSGN